MQAPKPPASSELMPFGPRLLNFVSFLAFLEIFWPKKYMFIVISSYCICAHILHVSVSFDLSLKAYGKLSQNVICQNIMIYNVFMSFSKNLPHFSFLFQWSHFR